MNTITDEEILAFANQVLERKTKGTDDHSPECNVAMRMYGNCCVTQREYMRQFAALSTTARRIHQRYPGLVLAGYAMSPEWFRWLKLQSQLEIPDELTH